MKFEIEINVDKKYADRAAANLEAAVGTLDETIAGQTIKLRRLKDGKSKLHNNPGSKAKRGEAKRK